MPIQKNQHYVPQAYLRNFSTDKNGKSISIFNIKSQKIINNAAIKSQCSQDYFYGADLNIENSFHELESKYGIIASKIISEKEELLEEEIEFLRYFVVIQHQRTYGAISRNLSIHEMIMSKFGSKLSDLFFNTKIDNSKSIEISLGVTRKIYETIMDLRFLLLTNRSKEKFFTCDDPVVLTNKFYHQKMNSNDHMFQSSGCIIYLPISPIKAIIFYDSHIYRSISAGYKFNIISHQDASAFNDLVFGKASHNIYFDSGFNDSDFSVYSERNRDQRKHIRFNIGICMNVKTDGNKEFYKEVEISDLDKSSVYLTYIKHTHPAPTRWASFIKYSLRLKFYSNGSAAGAIRPAIALNINRDLQSAGKTKYIIDSP